MRIAIFFSFLGLLSLNGCIAKPFQPAPPDFQRWHKDGKSESELKNSMIFCGFSNYFNNGNMSDNDYAEAQNCMIKQGYQHDYERGIFCDQKIYQHLKACKATN